jgi:hypothetical protein
VDFKPSEPRFHSLMTTDGEGWNLFMHVLTFHEEVNEAEIQGEDFDIINKIWAKQQEKECLKRKKKVGNPLAYAHYRRLARLSPRKTRGRPTPNKVAPRR